MCYNIKIKKISPTKHPSVFDLLGPVRSLATGVQIPFSLLYLPIRSSVSFRRGLASASSRRRFWATESLGWGWARLQDAKSNTKRSGSGSNAATQSNKLPYAHVARPWLA